MKYVHFRKIIHRDLKPNNILVASDGTIKICDFGVSKLMTLEEQTMTLGVGTQKFMAPEIINEEENYDEKADVYSFGVVIFFILNNGVMPNIKIGDIFRGKMAEIPSSFTQFAKELINSCWSFDPNGRPSFKQIISLMESNKYKLIDLNDSELKELQSRIELQKAKIPKYDE